MTTSSPRVFELLEVSPLAPEPGYQGPLILLVDDHEDTRELFRYVLEQKGYRVVEAGDGEAAIFLADSLLPDLILMDSALPRADGITAMLGIRDIAALKSVPIIFVSGRAETSRKFEALAAGADEYLIKPVNLDELKGAITRQLLRRSFARYSSLAKAS